MLRFAFSLVVLFAVCLSASAATLITTPLYDNYGGNSSCTNAAITTCNYNNWWNNASLQVQTWTDAGSYDNTSWVSAGKSDTYNYNWGNSFGGSFFTDDSGAGWNSSDYYNQYITSWSGQSLNTDGYLNTWGGNDNQLNHTLLNSVFMWSCTGDKCHQDNWWWSSNQFDYDGSGWWMATLFGEYYDSNTWQNAFSNLTTDHGHSSFDWNRNPASGVPEPGTNTLIAGGLIAFAALRRPWRTRTGLTSRSGKIWGKR